MSAVSVVTMAWRNEEFAGRFASSLARAAEAAGGPPPELIVVVNGPDGDAAGVTVDDACSATALRPRVVRLDANTGFSGGANAGVAVATGEVIVVANLDLVFDQAFLQVLHREAGHDGWDFLAPRVVQGEEGTEAGVARRSLSHRISFAPPPPTAAAVPAGNGSCLVFRRYALERRVESEGALFDPEFHSFNEDIDLFWWVEHAGLVVRYVPDLVVEHALGGSFGGTYRFVHRPPEVQRRVMANYRLTVWKNASGAREWAGWPVGEAVYLGQAMVSRGFKGAGAYAASWVDTMQVAAAISRRRGSLRPRHSKPSASTRLTAAAERAA